MLTMVIHYSTNKDPDVYFGLTATEEKKIIRTLNKDWEFKRSSPEEWYGQDIPEYSVHHWDAVKRHK